MTDFAFITARREGAALVVTLTNPPRNFLNATMVAELTKLAETVETDSAYLSAVRLTTSRRLVNVFASGPNGPYLRKEGLSE